MFVSCESDIIHSHSHNIIDVFVHSEVVRRVSTAFVVEDLISFGSQLSIDWVILCKNSSPECTGTGTGINFFLISSDLSDQFHSSKRLIRCPRSQSWETLSNPYYDIEVTKNNNCVRRKLGYKGDW